MKVENAKKEYYVKLNRKNNFLRALPDGGWKSVKSIRYATMFKSKKRLSDYMEFRGVKKVWPRAVILERPVK